jgi:hypothetical protein
MATATNYLAGSGNIIVDYNYGPADSPVKPAILISSAAGTNKAILVIRNQFRATAIGGFDTVKITPIQQVYGSNGLMNSTYPYFDAADGNVGAMNTYSAANNASTEVQSDTSQLKVIAAAAGPAVGQHVIKFQPALAGTYKFLISSNSGGSYTWEVTAVSPTYDHSTVTITAGGVNNAATATASGVTTLTADAAANTTRIATVDVAQMNTTSEDFPATSATSKSVVVAITKGLLSTSSGSYASASSSVTTAAGGTGSNSYYVYANGSNGSASITVTVNGVLVKTYPVVLKGTATAMAVTASQKWVNPTGSYALTVSAKDSAGNAAASTPAYKCTTSNAAVATVSEAGTITGVAAGDATITCADNAGVATSATWAVHVAPLVAAGLPTFKFNQETYAPGELMTITISAEASDQTLQLFTASPVTNATSVNVSGFPTNGQVSLVSGTATWKAYAPVTAGNFLISATYGAGVNGGAGGAFTATASIVNAAQDVAQAAADAAAEAIDAANAATDAANAAAEAADAATAAAQDAADAVAALSVSVAAMIDALKKQITSLTNLVIKIQKKVKA